MTEKFAWKL